MSSVCLLMFLCLAYNTVPEKLAHLYSIFLVRCIYCTSSNCKILRSTTTASATQKCVAFHTWLLKRTRCSPLEYITPIPLTTSCTLSRKVFYNTFFILSECSSLCPFLAILYIILFLFISGRFRIFWQKKIFSPGI